MRFDSVKVILFMLVILFVLSGAASASEQSAGGATAVRAELSKLPLSFIPNQGQADPEVQFMVKAEGHSIFFTNKEVVLVTDNDGTPVVFSTTVAGADPAAEVVGVDMLPGTANFLIGDDPAYWKSGLATYGGVEYKNILPGIDLTYRGSKGVLKREFVVAPGADASGIVITYDAVDGISYGPDGTLQVQTPAGVLTETAPVCYQVINGKIVDVPAQYTILGNGRVGFSFGSYDTMYPLVIDPALVYSSYLGGAVNDAAMGIAVDSLGQAYVIGYTESINFPITDSFNQTLNGCSDVFVTKVSADGESLVYSTYLGGNNTDVGNGIAVNSTGYAFVTGFTNSLNFPYDSTGTPKNDNTTTYSLCPFPGCLGNSDAFVSVISPEGDALPYSTCIGGNNTDVGTSIALDPDPDYSGYVYLTGYTNSNRTDLFPISTNALQSNLNLGLSPTAFDAFIRWYKPGVVPTDNYTSYLGGTNNEQGLGIAASFDGVSNIFYMTGWTQSTNFPTYSTLPTTILRGSKDGFVSKFDDTGTSPVPVYSRYLGGSGIDESRGIAVKNISGKEYAHVTGVTYSVPDFPVYPGVRLGGAAYATYNSGTTQFGDAFITKLQPNGTLNWSTYLGGINSDGGNGIALDGNNNIYITGYTSSSNFPSINPIPTFVTKHAFQDAFITMVNSNLTNLNFSTYLGASLDETGTGIAVSDPQNIFVSGYTTSYDFPTSLNHAGVKSFSTTYGNNGYHFGDWTDGFVVHVNNTPIPAPPVANFTYDKTGGTLPLIVNFTDTSTGSPVEWQWNFGDSPTNATGPGPKTHTYSVAGSYNVTLTVSNALGTSSKERGTIVVSVPPGVKFTNMTSTAAIGRVLLANNTTTNVRFYLNYTQYGLLGYNFTLRSNDSSTAEFWAVTRPGWMPAYDAIFTNSTLPDDNLTFAGMDLYNDLGYGATNVLLANITLKGLHENCTYVNISTVTRLQNQLYQNLLPLNPPDYQLEVCVENIYPVPESSKPGWTPQIPQDKNQDGLYEDINGDGEVSFYDVMDFFINLEWMATNEYYEFFDFDHDGIIEFGDIMTLFETGLP